MLGHKDAQGNFFDLEIFSKMIPKDHPLVLIRDKVSFSFVEEAVAHLYHPSDGRPSFPPETMFRILFVQVWGNLSDVQVCRELRFNLVFRYYCGIGWDDRIPDDTTLSVFRKRIGPVLFEELFNRLVQQAQEHDCFQGKWAVVDDTKLVAHTKIQGKLSLIREGRRRIIRDIEKTNPALAEQLAPLAEPLPDGDYPDQKQLLAAEIDAGVRLLEAAAKESTPAKIAKTYEGILAGDGTASLADPDARWGFKSKDDSFLGYKVHTACNEHGLITAAKVTAGNEHESTKLLDLLEQTLANKAEPEKLAADKGYDDKKLRQHLVESGIKPYIPFRKRKDYNDGFRFDPEKLYLTCPAGKLAQGKNTNSKGIHVFYFSRTDCATCPLVVACMGKPVTGKGKGKRYYVNPDSHKYKAEHLREAGRIRQVVERLFGNAKQWHRMGQARYRGLGRTAIQVYMTFIVLNAKKIATWRPAQGTT